MLYTCRYSRPSVQDSVATIFSVFKALNPEKDQTRSRISAREQGGCVRNAEEFAGERPLRAEVANTVAKTIEVEEKPRHLFEALAND